MVANTLFIALVSGFVILATIGHVLLLMALYPNIFGNPTAGAADHEAAEFLTPPRTQPGNKLAA